MASTWNKFKKEVAAKRSGGVTPRNEKKKGKIASSLVVQRMNPQPAGTLKKYQPSDARDFVDFSKYNELTLQNVKEACEQFYNRPHGTCDVLYSDRGPSCTKDDQIYGKKVFLVRFLDAKESCVPVITGDLSENMQNRHSVITCRPHSIDSLTIKRSRINTRNVCSSAFPKSVSMADVVRARVLVKPKEEKVQQLILESFDIRDQSWRRKDPSNFHIEDKPFAEGAFRQAFKAYTSVGDEKWVVKRFQRSSWDRVQEIYGMTLEQHTRKQVQMHAAARAITYRCYKSIKERELFGVFFSYNNIYFSQIENEAVTVERFIPGIFTKYINNTGLAVNTSKPDI